MRKRFGVLLSALAANGAALAAEAPSLDPKAEARAHWQGLARNDLDFAYALLRDNHPGMAPEFGDTAFRARIDAAYDAAKTRISAIETYASLRYTLETFAAAAIDEHVNADFGLQRKYVVWPGFLTRVDGERYFVVRAEGDDTSAAPAEGAELIACDGVAAAELARRKIAPNVADWSIEAQRAGNAWRLVVDERNGFFPALKSCTFEIKGARSETPLVWQGATQDKIAAVIARTTQSARSGYGVERLADGGFWIAMEHMDGEAEPVVQEALARRAELRAAPYVVVDVRGNGGGSSSYGDRLAKILFGRAPRYDGPVIREAWRASPGNLKAMEEEAENAPQRRPGDKDYADWTRSTAAMLKKALSEGRALAPSAPRKGETPPPFTDPAGGKPGEARIYLLTDNACFSSCLLMADTFKRLGAAQIGRATNAATNYMESRGEALPSRLAYFYFLQKASIGSPLKIGPYEPAARFDGDMRDTEALKRWVGDIAGGRRSINEDDMK